MVAFCKKCKSLLEWKRAYGMRVVRYRKDKRRAYSVKCPKCGHYEVDTESLKRLPDESSDANT